MTPFPTHTIKKIPSPVNWDTVPVLPVDRVLWAADLTFPLPSPSCPARKRKKLKKSHRHVSVGGSFILDQSSSFTTTCLPL